MTEKETEKDEEKMYAYEHTSYLLMIRYKHFIKIDHKANKYSPINILYIKVYAVAL